MMPSITLSIALMLSKFTSMLPLFPTETLSISLSTSAAIEFRRNVIFSFTPEGGPTIGRGGGGDAGGGAEEGGGRVFFGVPVLWMELGLSDSGAVVTGGLLFLGSRWPVNMGSSP